MSILPKDLKMSSASHLPAGSNHRAPIRSARRAVGQPLSAGEMGLLLAIAAAFFLIHIVAGTITPPASGNESAISGREATSSSYD
jgi:hypothetical protein